VGVLGFGAVIDVGFEAGVEDFGADTEGFGMSTDRSTLGLGTVTDERDEGATGGVLGRVFGVGETPV